MKDDRLYLIHILESIERVEEYTCLGLEQFLSDKKTQDAGFRNVLVHDYLGVNLITVWGIIEGPLKELKNRMSRILEDLQQP